MIEDWIEMIYGVMGVAIGMVALLAVLLGLTILVEFLFRFV